MGEFTLGPPAFSLNGRGDSLLRPSRSDPVVHFSPNFGCSQKRAKKAEVKARTYSHDSPNMSKLMCESCEKDLGHSPQDGLCARCYKGLQKAS